MVNTLAYQISLGILIFIYCAIPHSKLLAQAQDSTTTLPTSIDSSHWVILPSKDLFKPIVAAPRESFFSTRFERQELEDRRFSAAVVSFGDYLPFFNYLVSDEATLQISMLGSMHALYDLDTSSYNLINTDYIVGLALAYENESFNSRFKIYHFSSHLGDEFIIDNPEFERDNSSYEDLDLLLSYNFSEWRLYGGGGYIFRSNSIKDLDPWHFQSGIEYRIPIGTLGMDLLAGVDLELAERTNWDASISVLAGFVLLQSESKEVRLMANYYYGDSPHGQFFDERIEYWGVGLYFLV